MNLLIELKNQKTLQVEKLDDFGFQGGMLFCVKNNAFTKDQKTVAGWNLSEVASFQVDGEVIVNEVIYASGASVIYETDVQAAEV